MKLKIEVLLNCVTSWITNCFFSMNAKVLSTEAYIIPIDLYLEQICDMATIRWLTALPDNNIVTALFERSFPLYDSFRLPFNRMAAFSKAGGMKPKRWDSTSYTSVQRILPIDNMARCTRLLFPNWALLRKSNIWCNDPMISRSNNYQLSPNCMPRGSERWYGWVYLVYKRVVYLRQGQRYNRGALGTLLGRVTFQD